MPGAVLEVLALAAAVAASAPASSPKSSAALTSSAAPSAAAAPASAAALAPAVLRPAWAIAPLLQGERLAPGWHVVTLPHQQAPVTQFVPERVPAGPGGRLAVRLEAQRSYGNWALELPAGSHLDAGRRLVWSWRLQKPNASIDLHKRSGDDSPAKVCMSFDVPMDKLPFGDRQQLRMVHALTGQNLPTATLCWVWGGPEAHDALVDNPFTRRVRYIVLRNNADALDTWFDESRDVAADFKRAFGDESPLLPNTTAVLLGADADNTRGHTVAFVADLRVNP